MSMFIWDTLWDDEDDPWAKPVVRKPLRPAPCIPIDEDMSTMLHRAGVPDTGPAIVFWYDYNSVDFWMQGDYD